MPIDTDDLSSKTYKAVMVEAEKFDLILAQKFRLISGICKDEADFIIHVKWMIKQMLTYDEVEMDDMYFGEPPLKTEFHKALFRIMGNLNELAVKS
jgi:hypothetical protein